MLSLASLLPSYTPTAPVRSAVASSSRRATSAEAIAVTREPVDISTATSSGTCTMWQAGEPSNEPTVSCWLDEQASEAAAKDVWVCVHTHPCLDYTDKAPHSEDSW